MTTLTINCSLHCDKLMERPPGPLVFDRVFLFAGEPEPDTEDPWSIDSARLIQNNERSSVFRAELIRPNQQPEKVVLKIDPTGRREAEFITEAAAYETGAKELQGDIVPLFYGTFQTDIGNVVVTCTIIEYCGEPMEYALRDSDPGFLYVVRISLCIAFKCEIFAVPNLSVSLTVCIVTVSAMATSTSVISSSKTVDLS
jgi:hypothetical protein